MENLLVQSLFEYLAEEVDREFSLADRPREVRLTTTSFPPDVLAGAFRLLAVHVQQSRPKARLCFKVGLNLWEHWRKTGEADETLAPFERHAWIDTEGSLTYFRNQQCGPDDDGLVIVLAGIDRVDDKGGLDGFNRVDEQILWNRQLRRDYGPWVVRFLEGVGVESSPALVAEIAAILDALDAAVPRNLVHLARFFEAAHRHRADFASGADVIGHLFASLPAWGLFPIARSPKAASRAAVIRANAEVASRAPFVDDTKRAKALNRVRKLGQEIEKGEKTEIVPEAADGGSAPFADYCAFAEALEAFISLDDPAARTALMRADFMTVYDVLNFKVKGARPERVSEPRLHGAALPAFMTAIWQTVEELRRELGRGWIADQVTRIEVDVRSFHHDLGAAEHDTAEQLCRGLLGGIAPFLACEEPTLREAPDERERSRVLPIGFRFSPEMRSANSAYVGFAVTIVSPAHDKPFERLFRWVVGNEHPDRLLHNLARAARDKMGGTLLPAYHVQTYAELCFAADEEEASRLLGAAEAELAVSDLAGGELREVFEQEPAIRDLLREVHGAYGATLRSLVDEGYFHALGKPVLGLLQKLERLYTEVLCEANRHRARLDLGRALHKAFLLIPRDVKAAEAPLPSAVAFGLTPAVLEQLQAREFYLQQAFPRVLARLLEDTASRRELDDLFGMVTLQRPVLALIQDRALHLTTHSRALGHVHILGEPPKEMLGLASSAMRREEDHDDEQVDDRELFGASLESRIFTTKLREYHRVFPQAADGISVLALDIDNIQTLVAGVHEFLKGVSGERPPGAPPFQFSLRVFLRSASALGVQKWLEAWRRRWDPAKGQAIYLNCSLSIAFRPARHIPAYLELIGEEGEPYDIAFLVRFLRAHEGGDKLEQAHGFAMDDAAAVTLKFPITEAPRPRTDSPGERLRRQTNLSNRRLRLPTLHAELAARIQEKASGDHMVFAAVDHEPWVPLLDALHRHGRCTWVVCMDPSVDHALLAQRKATSQASREMVGFTSGLGGLGELNVTVSTESSSVLELTQGVRRQLAGLFPSWSGDSAQKAAQVLVQQAAKLTGFSLIQALNGERFMRETMSHALVRAALPPVPGALCDVLLSIDAYEHWMSMRGRGGGPERRPDLLHLVATLEEGGHIAISANVIECKLAHQSERVLGDAREQVEAGLSVLVRNFLPLGHGDPADDYLRRYWWAQLQRAIAAHSQIPAEREMAVAGALELLGEGRYAIWWGATIATFWTDVVGGLETKVRHGSPWADLGVEAADTEGCGPTCAIAHAAFGNQAIVALIAGEALPLTPAPGPGFKARGVQRPAWPTAPAGVVAKVAAVAPVEVPPSEPLAVGASAEATKVAEAEAPLDIAPHRLDRFMAEPRDNITDSTPEGGVPPPSSPDVPAAPATAPAHQEIPSRVLLGLQGSQEIYWEFGHPELTNRHLLIFGRSGSGKTYAIQCLLAELARAGQNSAIIDYTEGFVPTRLDPALVAVACPASYIVRNAPLPINPMAQLQRHFEGIGVIAEKPFEIAARVMSVFASVYQLGDQQRASLVEACKAAIAAYGEAAELKHVVEALEADQGATKGSAATLANKIKPFIEFTPFAPGAGAGWDAMYHHASQRLHVVQLASMPREIARIVTEFALWDLYNHAMNVGTDRSPMPLVLDEVQNLCHDLDAPVAKVLTEGRKFGLAGIFATQTMSNLTSEQQDRLFQAGHKLFFQPAETEVKEYAKLLAGLTGEGQDDWRQKLSSLAKGECYSYGPALDSAGRLRLGARRVKITPFAQRGLGHGG